MPIRHVFLFVFVVRVVFVNKAAEAEPFEIFVSDVESRFCPLSADKIPETVLGVAVDLAQAVRGVYDREEPVAPGQFIVLRALEQLSVEDADESLCRLLSLDFVSRPPAKKFSRLSSHLVTS